jgi:hypothetical protein
MRGIAGAIVACLVLIGSPAAGPAAAASPKSTAWLCKPGLERNPCAGDLDTTVVGPGGGTTRTSDSRGGAAPVDCFYVYDMEGAARTGRGAARAALSA